MQYISNLWIEHLQSAFLTLLGDVSLGPLGPYNDAPNKKTMAIVLGRMVMAVVLRIMVMINDNNDNGRKCTPQIGMIFQGELERVASFDRRIRQMDGPSLPSTQSLGPQGLLCCTT